MKHRSDCPGGDLCTLAGGLRAALRRGWRAGTVLEGTEAWNGASHTDRIRILWIDERDLFAERCDDRCQNRGGWILDARCWSEVTP